MFLQGLFFCKDLIFFFLYFPLPREFPISFTAHPVYSPTQDGDARETCEFARPDKLWKATSRVLVILMLGFYCM